MTVPGGDALEASAVTAVTTTSTHRRRGLASRLMARELAASAEREEQVSILIAAEWRIYGRFGYGAVTEHQTWTVDALAAQIRHRPQGTVQYVDRDTARALAPAVYERHRLKRPGEMSRPDYFWDIDFGILRYPSWSESKPGFHVVTRDPAGLVTGTRGQATGPTSCGSVRSTLPECSPPGPIWCPGGSSWRWWTPPAWPGDASR
jgi:hypothetical protein